MPKHFNVQVHIQEVDVPEGHKAGPFSTEVKGEKRSTPIIEVKTTADDLRTAVGRAMSYLSISLPADRVDGYVDSSGSVRLHPIGDDDLPPIQQPRA